MKAKINKAKTCAIFIFSILIKSILYYIYYESPRIKKNLPSPLEWFKTYFKK